MKSISLTNYIIHIGQNAQENWKLLDESNANDMFFHLSSFPSCYVMLQYSQSLDTDHVYDPDTIQICAKLCKEHNKYKLMNNIKVSYCKVSNLDKGEVTGEVYYKSNRKVKHILV
jgi:predicted ribosome quality control (RQC) complex YloA/Tae2 family protein